MADHAPATADLVGSASSQLAALVRGWRERPWRPRSSSPSARAWAYERSVASSRVAPPGRATARSACWPTRWTCRSRTGRCSWRPCGP